MGNGWEVQGGRGLFVHPRDCEGCGADLFRTPVLLIIPAALLSSRVLPSLLFNGLSEDLHLRARNVGWYVYGAIFMGLYGATGAWNVYFFVWFVALKLHGLYTYCSSNFCQF